MSKYKSLDEPITRREATLILDRKRFDGMVRSGTLVPLGKRSANGPAPTVDAGVTAPLLYDQPSVRDAAKLVATEAAQEATIYRAEAKTLAKRTEPLTRRQVSRILGKRLTGILVRSGKLVSSGKLTDTQTAAHTYDPAHVRDVLLALADERAADASLLGRSAKVRVPS
jgi:hypothetical protein